MIDDVLFIDISPAERKWTVANMYPPSLALKLEHESPANMVYLDLAIRHDRGGWYTDLYDKRDALHESGLIDVARKFPHYESKLSQQCKYSVLTSFMHRIRRGVMRRRLFVRHAAQRMEDMRRDGYKRGLLGAGMRRFMLGNFEPKRLATRVLEQVLVQQRRLQREA